MIEFKNVSKAFGSKQVLNGVCFSVRRGEIVFILGRSGMGKSVTLKHLVGLLRPDSGEIWVDGQQINGLSEEEFFHVRRKCGMVFQFPALLDSMNVFENIVFGARAHQVCTPDQEVSWVKEKLQLVGLDESVFERKPSELSFGTQKRVSIARTLAIKPSYLLFDEPTTSLDPVATKAIHELIHHLSRTLHVTSLVISHDMQGALSIADRVLLLNDGKIIDEGTPEQLRQSEVELTRDFLGIES